MDLRDDFQDAIAESNDNYIGSGEAELAAAEECLTIAKDFTVKFSDWIFKMGYRKKSDRWLDGYGNHIADETIELVNHYLSEIN